ncbi:hypothetical protein CR513_20926, partial [Mucuna pruriens]
MVLILRSLHPNYEHIQDQILSSKQIPSMNSLVTRLLQVPTITKGDSIAVENSTMPDKTANISLSDIPSNGRIGSQLISDEEYQEFLRLSPTTTPNQLHHQVFQLHAFLIPWGVKDRNTSQLIGEEHESRGLYYLSNNPSTLCFASISPKLLHNRLGHSNLAKLKLMVPSLNKLSTLECESYQVGKHVRSTFPNQVNKRYNFPFSIVHSDIWGPSRATSFGFNYFVTFIDEYSRCTWVYLMKERSEFLSILMSFSKEVENQFGKTIKILRSDNAKEYFSFELNSYLSSKGILHQSMCPHTSQQNGIAERKNRHLVETTRTLLLSANVPTNHWGEAILTTCFLINQMPSASLENQIPHSILFPKDKIYHVPPRALPIPYLSSTESSSFETHNQDILQPSSSVHSQAKLSPPSMSTCQSRTREMGTPVCGDPLNSCPLSSTDPTPDPPSSSPSHDSNIGWPIAFQKGIRSTRNPHPIYLSNHRLSPSYFSFVSSVSSITIPKSICEALDHPGWRQAMALEQSGPWELVSLPSSKVVGCRWVFAIKVGPNNTVDRLKAWLVAKGYTQVYDIKNAFLHGELDEEIYMEQPPSFVAQGESGLVCKLRRSLYGLKQSPRAWFEKFSQVVQNFGMTRINVYLVVYVDDIVITGNDEVKISQLKQYLFSHFQTKDLGHLKYFLGIEVAQSKEDIVISQKKYALDILQETSMSNCRPVDSPMANIKLMVKQGDPYSDPERYRKLVDLISPLQAPCVDHWATVLCIFRYIKKIPGQGLLYEDKGDTHILGYCDADWAGSPIDRTSTTGFCISSEGNVKQNTVARSNAETEYQAMASATCELIWVKQLIQELKFADVQPMKLYCDNQATLHIAFNPVFHERTKHIEIDCHFVQEKLLAKEISTEFVNSNNQFADIFTKSLRRPQIQAISSKLGAYNLYVPT